MPIGLNSSLSIILKTEVRFLIYLFFNYVNFRKKKKKLKSNRFLIINFLTACIHQAELVSPLKPLTASHLLIHWRNLLLIIRFVTDI